MSLSNRPSRASRARLRAPLHVVSTPVRSFDIPVVRFASVLIAGLGAVSAPAAQTPAVTTSLETVVVTGTRSPSRLDASIAEVTVIERSQIEAATGRTLSELLSREPGIQFWSNGGPGTPTSLSLRGLEARHTLLLIDGVRYGSATVGAPSWENIPLDAIERIEIVRGPLSGLYGSDAVGGVVQVFTRKGAPGVAVDASATAGSNSALRGGAGLRFGAGAIDGALRVGHTRSDGFSATNPRVQFGAFNPDDDGFRQDSGNLRLGVALPAGWRTDVSALAADGRVQFDDGPGRDSRAELSTRVYALQAAGGLPGAIDTTLRVARSTDRYDTRVAAFGVGVIETEQTQYAWENRRATPVGTVVLVADRTEQAVSRPGTPFTVSDRSINGVALGLDGRAGRHGWQANLRHDRNSQFGAQDTGAVGYGFDLTPAWRVAGSYGQSFVMPSFNLLYFPGFSNPLLQPEEGKHSELSLRWRGARQQARLAWFDNRIRGFIASGPTPTNIPRARIDGVTASFDAQYGALALRASVDVIDPRNDSGVNAGRQLPRRAGDALRIAADYALSAWQVGATFAAFSERFDDAANRLRIGGYGTLDLRTEYRLAPQWRLGVALNNVTDKAYETVYGYNQPGREVFVTLRYRGG